MLFYSHVNEDCLAERSVLQKADYECIACIAGSGERVISLLDQETVKEVVIIDSNPIALFLTELKIIALKELGPDSYIQFIHGRSALSKDEIQTLYQNLRQNLSTPCQLHWDSHKPDLINGILQAGEFEKFLTRLRPILQLLLGKNFLMSLKDEAFAKSNKFPTIRWKLLKFFFKKKWIYLLFGNKDIAFVGPGSHLATIPNALDKSILHGKAFNSFMTHLIFKGHLGLMNAQHLPHSMRIDFLKKVYHRLCSEKLIIQFRNGDWAEECKLLKKEKHGNILFSASDILSFESFDYVQKFVLATFISSGNKAVIIRSFLRNQLKKNLLEPLKQKIPNARLLDLSDLECTGTYKVFVIMN